MDSWKKPDFENLMILSKLAASVLLFIAFFMSKVMPDLKYSVKKQFYVQVEFAIKLNIDYVINLNYLLYRKNHQRAMESMQASLEAEQKSKGEALRIKKKLEGDINELEIALDHSNKANNEAQKSIKRYQV